MSVTTLVMPVPATPALNVYLLAVELMTVNRDQQNHLVDLPSFLSTTTTKDYHSMMPSNIVQIMETDHGLFQIQLMMRKIKRSSITLLKNMSNKNKTFGSMSSIAMVNGD